MKTWLRLGRVSNLPTVWSNTLAATVLAGAAIDAWMLLLLLTAMSLAYIGGMFLNDAFDRDIDAQERPERPIPSGDVSAETVFRAGYVMLAGAVVLAVITACNTAGSAWLAFVAGVLLCVAIILYNVSHKNNPISPLVMGLCRVFVYLTVAFALVRSPSFAVHVGALCLLCFLIGLTYTAKQENLGEVKNLWPLGFILVPIVYGFVQAVQTGVVWIPLILLCLCVAWAVQRIHRRGPGDIPRAVVTMIAGISLVDAVLIASVAGLPLALWAVVAFALTLLLQRFVAGT